MKYKITITLLLCIAGYFQSYAQDVAVKVTNIIKQLDGTISPGEIEFTFGSGVYGDLLLETEEWPTGCGTIFTSTLDPEQTNIFTIPINCSGEYCFSLANEQGCSVYFCESVNYCRYSLKEITSLQNLAQSLIF